MLCTLAAVAVPRARAAGTISTVVPAAIPWVGSRRVTITGSSLGSGSDVTTVLFGSYTALAVLSQSTTQVVAISPQVSGLVEPLTVNITVRSTSAGNTTALSALRFNPTGYVTSVAPAVGPTTGGFNITVVGNASFPFCSGVASDIVSVFVKGIGASHVAEVSATRVVATVSAVSSAGAGDVTVNSNEYGSSSGGSGLITFYTPGTIASVAPSNATLSGGVAVVINGSTPLGNGSDIVSVSLAGVAATIVAQNASTVVVVAGAASAIGTGNVTVVSTSHGTASGGYNAFEYTPAVPSAGSAGPVPLAMSTLALLAAALVAFVAHHV